eukprot:CAMPEP_0177153306 /NCGR_PEP_ID=MMETSP0367-20130122/1002_1 /TAXON_ID=447022 ORGANISM="Scrippsiella hangoei-like, Strain SHHI-4" /NCGR_SAMPLE_ID=MMETSP0367 /ASSEMBLY_ACC=CAM_ASM_000362 /LENGTH=168 /DNA_ID=CAMNT_0018598443 /DNA_START=1 /DNA_END=510 /DNA_ORIENTATION=-
MCQGPAAEDGRPDLKQITTTPLGPSIHSGREGDYAAMGLVDVAGEAMPDPMTRVIMEPATSTRRSHKSLGVSEGSCAEEWPNTGRICRGLLTKNDRINLPTEQHPHGPSELALRINQQVHDATRHDHELDGYDYQLWKLKWGLRIKETRRVSRVFGHDNADVLSLNPL